MEPVYTQVARDLDVVQTSVAELKNGDDAAVTWWSAERLRTWSTRPWNQDGQQLPLVHHASVGIEVKFRDFAALSAWVGEHVTNTGGFHVTNIRWALTVKRRDELIRQVRERAVHDALERAQLYADALGLGKISPVPSRSLTLECWSPTCVPTEAMGRPTRWRGPDWDRPVTDPVSNLCRRTLR